MQKIDSAIALKATELLLLEFWNPLLVSGKSKSNELLSGSRVNDCSNSAH